MRKMFSKEQIEKMIQGMASEIAEKIAKDLISDDKEVISKIVVDTEYDQTKLPKNVLPIMYYSVADSDAYYFDYKDGKMTDGIDSTNDVDISIENNQVIIDSDLTIDENDILVYCYFENLDANDILLNFTNLIKAIPTEPTLSDVSITIDDADSLSIVFPKGKMISQIIFQGDASTSEFSIGFEDLMKPKDLTQSIGGITLDYLHLNLAEDTYNELTIQTQKDDWDTEEVNLTLIAVTLVDALGSIEIEN